MGNIESQQGKTTNEIIEEFKQQYLFDENKQLKKSVQNLKFPDKSSYLGEIQSNQKQGKGIFITSDNIISLGEFINDQLHGFGIQIFPNGERYEGQFEFGMKNGKGKFYKNDGSYTEDFWVNNQKFDDIIQNQIIQDQSNNQLMKQEQITPSKNINLKNIQQQQQQMQQQQLKASPKDKDNLVLNSSYLKEQQKFKNSGNSIMNNNNNNQKSQHQLQQLPPQQQQQLQVSQSPAQQNNSSISEMQHFSQKKLANSTSSPQIENSEIKVSLLEQNASIVKQFEENYIFQASPNNALLRPGVVRAKVKNCEGNYTGEISSSKMNGYGIFRFHPSGDVYIGIWKNGKFEGQGIYCFSNGERYEGQFVCGKKCGPGKYFYVSGNQYEGVWQEDRKEGVGKLWHYAENRVYMLNYKAGKREGECKVYDESGKVVMLCTYSKGQLTHSQNVTKAFLEKENQGQLQAQNREIIDKFRRESVFVNGTSQNIDQQQQQIINQDGQPVKRADVVTIQLKSGGRYEGRTVKKKMNGKGIFYFDSGDIYAGEFKDNKFNGYGFYCFANGERYEGDFLNGQKHGFGNYFYLNGDKYEGQWEGDLKDGFGSYYGYIKGENDYTGIWIKGRKKQL